MSLPEIDDLKHTGEGHQLNYLLFLLHYTTRCLQTLNGIEQSQVHIVLCVARICVRLTGKYFDLGVCIRATSLMQT